MAIKSNYLGCVLTPAGLRKTVRAVADALRPHKKSFDCVAFRGMSGALVAPPAAAALGKGLLMVRKEDSHSKSPVEGPDDVSSYVIVDDLVCTGGTVREVRELVKGHCPGATCLGVLLYNYGSYTSSAVNFFRSQAGLAWLPVNTPAERAEELLRYAADYCCYRSPKEWEEIVYGRVGEVTAMRPALDVFFPPGPAREAARATPAWAKLEELRARMNEGRAAA